MLIRFFFHPERLPSILRQPRKGIGWLPLMALTGLLGLCLASDPAQAEGFGPARDSRWYYQIGGAQAVSLPANTYTASTTLGGSIDLSHIYSCGNFNPVTGLSNILNNSQGQVMSAYGGMVTAVTSAIGALPAFILQRAAPGLYDLYQNAVIRGELLLNSANASCQQMENEIRNGQNPYERFTRMAKFFDWKVQMGNGAYGSSSTDVKSAMDTVNDNGGKNGIPWLGGSYAGGENQPPVMAISDTIQAGYNIELNRDVSDTSPAPVGNAGANIATIWKTPDDAKAYGQFVLGDIAFQTGKQQQRRAMPGHGILPKIEFDKTPILKNLRTLVNGTDNPTPDQLEAVSIPGLDMTREVIDAIRALPTSQEKEAAAQKLADEAATGLNLQRALLLKRLLQSGRMEPNIYASGVTDEIDAAINQVTQAIDNVLYETRIRREMFAQTATVLLSAGQYRTTDIGLSTRSGGNDGKPLINGAVK